MNLSVFEVCEGVAGFVSGFVLGIPVSLSKSEVSGCGVLRISHALT